MQSNRPYPLVGAISPWNFPLLLGLIDAVPALAAGCAVLVKPSEVTPRFIAPLMRTITAVSGLAEVLAVTEGAGETGAAMVDLVDAVCFTGSVPTGRLVAAAAARAFIPAFLELGGKDPAVVLASADLDRAAAAVLWGGTANAGQSCQSIERVYVDASVYTEFVGRLVDRAKRLRLAWPTTADGEIGPIIDPEQARVIGRHLDDAAAKGAHIHCGGVLERHGGGWWCAPTVLTHVDHSMLIMTEETFGPVLPVMPFADVDEAVRLANDTTYGLSAAVLAGTTDEAMAVAGRLEAGAVSINDAALTAIIRDGEKHSVKASGLGGSRMGPASLRRFLRRQAMLINDRSEPDPWWFKEDNDGN
jgi:aldehyde dehydrogenase (NAD+)